MMDTASNGNYYEVLGLDSSAGANDIKRAFHKLALKYHPDRNHGDNEAAEKFREVLEAYKNLTDQEEKEDRSHEHKSNGTEDLGKGFRFKYGNRMESTAQPSCPGCTVEGMEHIICKKGGDVTSGRKKLTASPFMVIFCDQCGHVYNVFNTGL